MEKLRIGEHNNKLMYLEESFNKIEMGSKVWTLLYKGVKDEATEIEFDLNENTNALTRNTRENRIRWEI